MRNYIKPAELKENYAEICSEWIDENFMMLIKHGYVVGKYEAGEICIDETSFARLLDVLNTHLTGYNCNKQ